MSYPKIISSIFAGVLLVTNHHEITTGATEGHLPPAGVSLTANSSMTASTAIAVTYDTIRESEYSAPADEQLLKLSDVIGRTS